MTVWWHLVRLGALHHFAWRVDVLLTLASSAMVVVLNGSLWWAAVGGEGQVAGLSPRQVLTYVVVAWAVSRVTGTRLDDNLGQRVASGQIATDLLKPLDLVGYLVARDVGRAAVMAVLTAAPLVLLGAALFPFDLPPDGHLWVIWPLSVVLGLVIGSHVAVLVGLLAVRLKRVQGLVQLKDVGVAILSGALVPLPLMPDVVRLPLLWSPLQGMAHTPAILFVQSHTLAEALGLLGVQLAWAVVLVGLARWSWTRVLHHLTVEGG